VAYIFSFVVVVGTILWMAIAEAIEGKPTLLYIFLIFVLIVAFFVNHKRYRNKSR
jgi:hypothetical protein